MGLQIKVIDEESDLNEVMDVTRNASILVDAMFGTGLRGKVKGVAQKVIEMINRLEVPVIAVDIPSGICGETGKILGSAIKSQQTVTLALP